jgi:hypothetical protein
VGISRFEVGEVFNLTVPSSFCFTVSSFTTSAVLVSFIVVQRGLLSQQIDYTVSQTLPDVTHFCDRSF